MAYDIYSSTALMGAYGVIDVVNPVIYDAFFTRVINFDTQYVVFDKCSRARSLAPLVTPGDTGPVDKLRSYATTQLQPAYIKVRDVIEPYKMLARKAGESVAGSMSPQERFQAIVLDQLGIQVNKIMRRQEATAVEIMRTGKIVLQGPGYPTSTLDYLRPAAHTIQLSGANAWGQTGVDPLTTLHSIAATVQKNSGFRPNKVFMDPLAWEKFRLGAGTALVMNSYRQQTGNVELAGADVGGIGNECQKVADLGGFEIFLYQAYFTDASGAAQQMMPDNTVIMGNVVGAEGHRLYGAIQDFDAGLVATDNFSKMWVEHNPSVAMLQTQSSPLPALGWAEATACVTVA